MQAIIQSEEGCVLLKFADGTQTIAQVKRIIEAQNGIPVNQQRLILQNGKELQDALRLAEIPEAPNDDSMLLITMKQGSLDDSLFKDEKSNTESVISLKKGRCVLSGCCERVAKVIGDCRYCSGSFCGKHRLPESHACKDISTCRQQSFEKNSTKLFGEKCMADKI